MSTLEHRFLAARRDPALAVLEGFHAVKHALRFGAALTALAATSPDEVAALAAALAPDVAARLLEATVVDGDTFATLAPRAPRTGVIALAARPPAGLHDALAARPDRPVVLLEAPRTMGNVGACVRVAAAADAAAVVTTGPADPWHPDALRGAAGLQFALPVARIDDPLAVCGADRALCALDPEGEPFDPARVPSGAVLAFGTERDGLTPELLVRADHRWRLPMREGVSSLNLATSVAAVLYALRFAGR